MKKNGLVLTMMIALVVLAACGGSAVDASGQSSHPSQGTSNSWQDTTNPFQGSSEPSQGSLDPIQITSNPQQETTPAPTSEPAAGETTESDADTIPQEAVQLLNQFQKAMNNRNMNTFIECLSPEDIGTFLDAVKTRNSDRMAITVIEPYVRELLNDSSLGSFTEWNSITIEPVSFEISETENEGSLSCALSVSKGSKGKILTREVSFPINIQDGQYFFRINKYAGLAALDYMSEYQINPNLTKEDLDGRLYPYEYQKGLWCLLTEKGEPVMLSAPFSEILGNMSPLSEGGSKYFAVRDSKNGCYGFIDRSGTIVTYCAFPGADGISGNGFYPVKGIDGTFGFYCPETGVLTPLAYGKVKSVEPDSNGFFYVQQDNKWGLFQPSTEESIPCAYEDMGIFYHTDNTLQEDSRSIIPVKQERYWGLLRQDGTMAVDFLYDQMGEHLVGDMIGVAVNGAWGVIKTDGSFVVPLTDGYTGITISDSGLIVAQKGNYSDIYNRSGNLLYTEIRKIEWIARDRAIIKHAAHGLTYIACEHAYSDGIELIDGDGTIIFDITKKADERIAQKGGQQERYFLTNVYHQPDAAYLAVVTARGWGNSGYGVVDIIDYDGNSLIESPMELDKIYFNDSPYFSNHGEVCVISDSKSKCSKICLPKAGKIYDISIESEISEFVLLNGMFFYRHSREYLMLDLNTGTNEVYKDIKWVNSDACILFNGIYYALYLNDGLYGDGFAYNKISYGGKDGIVTSFILEKGSNKETVLMFHGEVYDPVIMSLSF